MATITATANTISAPITGMSVGDTITLTGPGTVEYTTSDETTIKSGTATWIAITLGSDNKATFIKNNIAIRLTGITGTSSVVTDDGDALRAMSDSTTLPYVTTTSRLVQQNAAGTAIIGAGGAALSLAGSATQDFATKNLTASGPASSTAGELNLKTITALADSAATLTGTQLRGGMFTITPTVARILTTDTAAAILAANVGHVDGSHFEITIVNNAAFDVTLVAGANVTIVGKAIANNVSGTFRSVRTSATTVSIFRM